MSYLDCPLCGHSSALFAKDRCRAFFRCSQCELVFADPASHLSALAEKAVYDRHENNPFDPSYRRFLNQLAEPLLSRLTAGMHGIDYGCGLGPTLSVMLEEAGMEMQVYDPYFVPDMGVLDRKYDFVTCTEVAEHFYQPASDWGRLVSLLRRGSLLGVMTRLFDGGGRFDQWYYKNDPTHVSFYSSNTFSWLAARYKLRIEHQDQNVILFLKN